MGFDRYCQWLFPLHWNSGGVIFISRHFMKQSFCFSNGVLILILSLIFLTVFTDQCCLFVWFFFCSKFRECHFFADSLWLTKKHLFSFYLNSKICDECIFHTVKSMPSLCLCSSWTPHISIDGKTRTIIKCIYEIVIRMSDPFEFHTDLKPDFLLSQAIKMYSEQFQWVYLYEINKKKLNHWLMYDVSLQVDVEICLLLSLYTFCILNELCDFCGKCRKVL